MDAGFRRAMLLAAGAGALWATGALARRRAYDFAGKTALITGGSRGLGLVLARELAREGASVAICARDAEELVRARDDLAARGAEALAVPCDVTDREDVERLAAAVRARFGRIDVLVNNAGIIQVGPVELQTVEDYERALAVHFWGPLYTTLAVLPEMRERGEGRIVNVSSIGGKVSVPHLLPYCASKFALTGFSEGLRAELAKEGIAVTTVCPGLMRTGSPVNAEFKGRYREEYAWFILSDSLPGSSMNAERAARQIVEACRWGRAEVVPGLPAKAVALFHGVFPGATADLLAGLNRLLPGPDGAGPESHAGSESESRLTRSWLTGLTREAARAHNETG